MGDKIFDFEELDEMITKGPVSDTDLEGMVMQLEASKLALRNKRTREKTLEDAMAGYDGLLTKSKKTVDEGISQQAAMLKTMGRAETGNTDWSLPAEFLHAQWLIADHEGAQTMRTRVLNADYGMSLEEEYKPLLTAHQTTIAKFKKELIDRKLEAQKEQAQSAYETALSSIEGGD